MRRRAEKLGVNMGTPPPAETRAVVSWQGPGEPIVLAMYGPDGDLAVALLPERALTLVQELLTRGAVGGTSGPRLDRGLMSPVGG